MSEREGISFYKIDFRAGVKFTFKYKIDTISLEHETLIVNIKLVILNDFFFLEFRA